MDRSEAKDMLDGYRLLLAEETDLRHAFDLAIEALKQTEIVRCEDCKYRQEDVGMGDHCWCDIANGSRHSDDFCSYGERKDNE